MWSGSISTSPGVVFEHSATAKSQRGWKRQPDGGSMALGISPLGIACFLLNLGSGTGTAASNEIVYG